MFVVNSNKMAEFTGVFRNGVFIPDHDCASAYHEYIKENEGKKIKNKITSFRTNKANAYYWGVVIEMLARHCEENNVSYFELKDILEANIEKRIKGKQLRTIWHEYFKTKYFNLKASNYIELEKYKAIDGTEIEILKDKKSTRNLSKDEFFEYVQYIIDYAKGLGVIIPPPDAYYKDKSNYRAFIESISKFEF